MTKHQKIDVRITFESLNIDDITLLPYIDAGVLELGNIWNMQITYNVWNLMEFNALIRIDKVIPGMLYHKILAALLSLPQGLTTSERKKCCAFFKRLWDGIERKQFIYI